MKREIDWSDGDPDVPILGFFLGATCIMCCFGFVLYWLMQPTVLPSKELVKAPLRPAAFVLAAAPSVDEDREKASLERANQENIEQGLKPPTVVAAHALEPKRESGAARSFKPKQVAKAKKRGPPPTQRLEPRNSWAHANPNGKMSPMFGGFFR